MPLGARPILGQMYRLSIPPTRAIHPAGVNEAGHTSGWFEEWEEKVVANDDWGISAAKTGTR